MLKYLSCLFFFCSMIACGSSSDTDDGILGLRWQVKFVRGLDTLSFTSVTGEQQWWLFKSGNFTQKDVDYVEVGFYDAKVACNGTASGTFSMEKDSNTYDLQMTYETFSKEISGLCRMADRQLRMVLQPSGYLDVYDGEVVQRCESIGDAY